MGFHEIFLIKTSLFRQFCCYSYKSKYESNVNNIYIFFCSAMITTKTVWGSLRFWNTGTRLEPSMIYTEIYQRSSWWHPWSSCWRQMYVHVTIMIVGLHFTLRLPEWVVPQGTKRHVLQILSSEDFIAAYCSMFWVPTPFSVLRLLICSVMSPKWPNASIAEANCVSSHLATAQTYSNFSNLLVIN